MIHIFLGTKAQLIKMAPIMQELQNRNIEYNFVFSGQHQTTINDIRKEFGVKNPDYILYKGEDITGIFQMLLWIIRVTFLTWKNRKQVWKGDKNGIVLNHGDTFSTLLGSFCAKTCGLKTAHIESGLRSFNIFHPFPEELTRRITFLLTDYFFAPGEWAIENIKKYSGVKINTINNTLLDSLNASENKVDNADIEIPDYQYGVVSIHRFENIFSKNSLAKTVSLIEKISTSKKLVFILHKPTLINLKKFGLYNQLRDNLNIELRPRYSYFQFIKLLKSADFIITDGGSNQEECFYLGKPCLIFRNATERNEGLGHNAVLSRFDKDVIDHFINNVDLHKSMPVINKNSPSSIIVDKLASYS